MSAVISPCGIYRYWLERGPIDAPYVAWVLANPSTADAEQDDPTVRKARGFTERWGYRRFVFVNLFAARSTDPKGLLSIKDPEGPWNTKAIADAIEGAEFVVFAWGNAIAKQLRKRAEAIALSLTCAGYSQPIKCLGYTADRQPRHPLMLAYTTPLETYQP